MDTADQLESSGELLDTVEVEDDGDDDDYGSEEEEEDESEDSEDVGDDEGAEDANVRVLPAGLMYLFSRARRGQQLRATAAPSQAPQPLRHQLALQLNSATSAVNRQLCLAPTLDRGVDPFTKEPRTHGPQIHSGVYACSSFDSSLTSAATLPALQAMPEVHRSLSDLGVHVCQASRASPPTPASAPNTSGQERLGCIDTSEAQDSRPKAGLCNAAGPSTSPCTASPRDDSPAGRGVGYFTRLVSRKRAHSRSSDGGPEQRPAEVPPAAGPTCEPSTSAPRFSGATQPHHLRVLLKRELGLGDVARLSRPQQLYMQCHGSALPVVPTSQIAEYDERCYIGRFSRNGAFFIAAYQNQRVRVFDVDRGWTLRKEVQPRGIRWTITDTCTSPDQRFLLYASINPTIHMVDISNASGPVNSLANITEVHEALDFDDHHRNFGIWSVRWNLAADQLIAGTNNAGLYIYDIQQSRVVGIAQGHSDDVNAVEYLDDYSPNMILTGSDDASIKVGCSIVASYGTGAQLTPGGAPRAVGVFIGHTEGLTHMNAKGDGRYWISNCKDQTIKLWDVRMGMRSESEAAPLQRSMPSFAWDYRWMEYPGTECDVRHPHDASIHTYKGHRVLKTLIRAYWSPAATTGQRLIYTGSDDGHVYIYDVVTGQQVAKLMYHAALVRDASWHPDKPLLASVSWDGEVVAWTPSPACAAHLGGKPFSHTPLLTSLP